MNSLVHLHNFATNATNFLNFVLLAELAIVTDKLNYAVKR